MNEKLRRIKTSKLLSYVLRHHPESYDLHMCKNGWIHVSELVEKLKIDIKYINRVVSENDKKRFEFSEDGLKIRARQGHSVKVDVELKEVVPPQSLYHGTSISSVDIIMKEGLSKMNRNHVHLSLNKETAVTVGSRRGKFVILEIETMRMRADGFKFYLSNNGVYLTDNVPSKYIKK